MAESAQRMSSRKMAFVMTLSGNNPESSAGLLYDPYADEGMFFSSVSEAILAMDLRMNEASSVERWMDFWDFADDAERQNSFVWERGADRRGIPGRQEVFYICIYYRRNNTWQGKIQRYHEEQERTFRSVLELLYLLESAK